MQYSAGWQDEKERPGLLSLAFFPKSSIKGKLLIFE